MTTLRQGVNLLPTADTPASVKLSVRQMLFSLGGVAVLTLALAVWTYQDHQRLVHQRHHLAQQVETLRQSVQELAATVVTEPDPRLRQTLRRLEDDLRYWQRLQDFAGAPDTDSALDGVLRAVARQRPDGLWLTHIEVGPQHGLILEGIGLSPELLPEFIQGLGLEPPFSGRVFREVVLYRPEASAQATDPVEQADSIRFRLVAGCEPGRCPTATNPSSIMRGEQP